jgi:uncharacterized protein
MTAGGGPAAGRETLAHELLSPAAFARVATTRAVTLVETHISWVFLLDRDVIKVKKPVDLGFLDFRSLERRRRACEDEVRLNARLAPDVYKGVLPVTRARDGTCAVGGDGETVDWAVHMVRLDDAVRADRLLASCALGGEGVDRIASVMAAFHASAATSPAIAAFGTAEAVVGNVEENFRQTAAVIGQYLDPAEVEEVERWQETFVRGKPERFADRIARGRVRDGHGDLRLEHVYLEPARVRVIDCIEFNERFRYGDVCADIAFLAMDLAAHGRVDLAERLIASYAREADDYDLYSVVDFYGGYRAFVRGKIATIVAGDPSASDEVRRRSAAEARRYFRLALSFERPSVVGPVVVAVGGVIASGKSAIAARLGGAWSAPVIEADRTRKAMLGVDPRKRLDDPAWAGAYDPAVTERVYAELLRRAGIVLASGRPVILDASFRTEALRRRARELAASRGVPFRFVECRTSREVCLARLAERERRPSVSDGRTAIFDAFCERYEPSRETEPDQYLALDTTRSVEQTFSQLAGSLGGWPAGLTS